MRRILCLAVLLSAAAIAAPTTAAPEPAPAAKAPEPAAAPAAKAAEPAAAPAAKAAPLAAEPGVVAYGEDQKIDNTAHRDEYGGRLCSAAGGGGANGAWLVLAALGILATRRRRHA